jgi:catalase
MNGSGVHAYKFVNQKCQTKYVKFTWKSRQGNIGLNEAQAQQIQATNFNNLTQDLYENITKKNFPIWDLYIQTLNLAQINDFDFNPLDATKTWPENLAPPKKVGELVLNQVPDNFFQTTEQSAFAPNNLIPGIEPSEDRLLQGRLFAYADTQRYRLGINHQQLQPNKPLSNVQTPTLQDGAGNSSPKSSSVNYYPSNNASNIIDKTYKACPTSLQGQTGETEITKTQNFKQAGELYRSFDQVSQDALVASLGKDLGLVKNQKIRNIITAYLYKADQDYGRRVAEIAQANLKEVIKLAASYPD